MSTLIMGGNGTRSTPKKMNSGQRLGEVTIIRKIICNKHDIVRSGLLRVTLDDNIILFKPLVLVNGELSYYSLL